MKKPQPIITLIKENESLKKQLTYSRNDLFVFDHLNNPWEVLKRLESNNYSCLVIFSKILSNPLQEMLGNIKKCFLNYISIVAIMPDHLDLNMARKLGELGVDHVFGINDTNHLISFLQNIKNKKIRISSKDLGIDITLWNDNVCKSIQLMEKSYWKMNLVSDVAKELTISLGTLSRWYKDEGVPISPKTMLMKFKLHHAAMLLRESDLKLVRIAKLSGFINEQRMSENFKRTFLIPPGTYRKTHTPKC